MALALPKPLRHILTHIPLRWVLVVPFVLQTLGAVGLVGYLSYRSGQRSVANLVDQLMTQTGRRISNRLDAYLRTPQDVVRLNQLEMEQGMLEPESFPGIEQQNFNHVRAFEDLISIGWANAQGRTTGIGRDNTGALATAGALVLADETTPGVRRFYELDSQGNRLQLLAKTPGYDARQRPWYQLAVEAEGPIWTPVYPFVGLPIATINFSTPVYRNGELQGVFTSAILLAEIDLFLSELNFSPSGKAFIIDRSGHLIATSTQEQPFIMAEQEQASTQIQAIHSEDVLIRSTTRELLTVWDNLQAIQAPYALQLKTDTRKNFAQVMPYQDEYGLDWLLVVAVPETDFMADIYANNARTVLLSLLTFLATSLLGFWTARRITAPVLRLNQASLALAEGKWQQPLSETSSIAELQTLTISFNQTAKQLHRLLERAKVALYESEDKFAKVFRASPNVISITSFDTGAYLEVNDQFLTVTGFSRAEVIGKTPLELGLLPQPEKTVDIVERLTSGHRLENYELVIKTKAGEIKVGMLSVELIEIEGQSFALGVFNDYSERKQAETALQQSEVMNRALVQALPDLLIRMHRDGTYLSVDYSDTVKLFNAPALRPGADIADVLPSSLVQQRMAYVEQTLITGKEQIYEYQIWIDGIAHYEEARIVPLEADEVLVIVRDISDRKTIEEALRQSETRFRLAFEDAAIGMTLVSLEGKFVQVNRALCDITGYSEAELLQLNFQQITHPDDLNADLDNIQQLLVKQSRFYQMEKRYIHKRGHVIWAILSASLIDDQNGRPLYFVSQIQDISDRHSADRVKNEFISVVSHELRTPLTGIRGSLGLLLTGKFDQQPDKFHHILQLALKNSERLIQLINDILDLERLESDNVELVKETYSLPELLYQAVESVQILANQQRIILQLDAAEVTVEANGGAIIQTLTNLLSNAIKFSPADSTIQVNAAVIQGKYLNAEPHPSTPCPYILFSVADPGRGIPAEKLDSIFERFQQVDASDTRQKGGTGLGLAICKTIVQQHGGEIWVESTLDQGSTFYFTLPA
ncbi:MAG: PAS domain S-box protein [Leptolyngbya sp. LCM1.Bin17]|nr:MAG: PAS domain S-box protein [Leptolyngbya sp. LCM1.Bin17]